MMRTLLIRGMVAGLLGGLLAFAFAYVFGEPSVDKAIAFEAARDHAMHMADGPELVSRGVQSTLGLLTATTVVGVALGGLVSLVFAAIYGRVGRLGARATALAIAAGGFVVFVLVPLTKYPANPPSIGSPDTIAERTELYFGLLLITVIAIAAAVGVARRRLAGWGSWNATIAGLATFVGLIALAEVLLPAVNEVPTGFPADLLWHFRLASTGIQGTLWATIGLGFGWAAERAISGATLRRQGHAWARAEARRAAGLRA